MSLPKTLFLSSMIDASQCVFFSDVKHVLSLLKAILQLTAAMSLDPFSAPTEYNGGSRVGYARLRAFSVGDFTTSVRSGDTHVYESST